MKDNNENTANKGEWSEFYAFLKVLEMRQLPAANKKMEVIPDKLFVFQKVIRGEKDQPIRIYDLGSDDKNIPITNEDGSEVVKMLDVSSFGSKTRKIFERIKQGEGSSFAIPEADELMGELLCTKVKASNEEKADLVAIIYDRISQTSPMLGFSIKSMVGGASTLLNAGKTTNFIFKVNNFSGNIDEVNAISTKSKIRDRIAHVKDRAGEFEFHGVADEQFERNMRMIDTALPEFVSHMLFDFFTSERRTVLELTEELATNEGIQEKYKLTVDDYAYKVRHFLDAIALGMVPSKPWDGFMSAQGGYIVVKENGDVICYHLYNRDEFQLYLYENTRLEAASSRRHEYGSLYEKDGELYFNLNLQIRFLK